MTWCSLPGKSTVCTVVGLSTALLVTKEEKVVDSSLAASVSKWLLITAMSVGVSGNVLCEDVMVIE